MAKLGIFGRHNDEPEPQAVGTAGVLDRDRHPDRNGDASHDTTPQNDTPVHPDRPEPAPQARDRVESQEERLINRNGDTALYRTHSTERTDADTNRDGVVDPDEARAAHERTEARLAARERAAAQQRLDERTAARDRTGTPEAETPRVKARASMVAAFALLVGLTSVYAALTGLLAPPAVAVGALGLLVSLVAFPATRRPRVAGRSLAMLALLLSVAGIVLGVLAMNHATSWLDSDVDQVARWRDWLDAHLPFIRGW